jgi:acyl carrier protein
MYGLCTSVTIIQDYSGRKIMTVDSAESMRSSGPSLYATEHTVAELWKEALQTAELPAPTDDFFYLGGDSMTMVMVEFRINEEFGVALPPGTILGASTLRELSALVQAAHSGERQHTPQPESGAMNASTLAP